MTYVASTLPEINLKLNRILMNQRNIETILKNKGGSLDETITSDFNLIECCPINTPHDFMVFNQKLSDDKEFLTRFVCFLISIVIHTIFKLFFIISEKKFKNVCSN